MANKKDKDISLQQEVESEACNMKSIKKQHSVHSRWFFQVFLVITVTVFGYLSILPAWSDQAIKERFIASSFEEIMEDPELYKFAVNAGQPIFKKNCVACHGVDGSGGNGYPNLTDGDWIWGGMVQDIYQTIKYGIRSKHDDTRISEMPSYAGLLSKSKVKKVAIYTQELAKGTAHPLTGEETRKEISLLPKRAVIYMDYCADCHGYQGQGDRDLGAPKLNDDVWFHGNGELDWIIEQLTNPQHGVMPHWSGKLEQQSMRKLAVYIHSLGGGE